MGTCQIIGGNFKCNCIEGYTGTHCEIDPCSRWIFKKKINKFKKIIWSKKFSGPCENQGTCSVIMKNGVAEYECTCLDGYSGNECQINPCMPNPCDNGGVCIINGNTWACNCPTGYNGKTCSGDLTF